MVGDFLQQHENFARLFPKRIVPGFALFLFTPLPSAATLFVRFLITVIFVVVVIILLFSRPFIGTLDIIVIRITVIVTAAFILSVGILFLPRCILIWFVIAIDSVVFFVDLVVLVRVFRLPGLF